MIRLTASCTLLAALCAPAGLASQRPSPAPCGPWASTPGSSTPSTDSVYAPCALDRAPVLRAGAPMPPVPWFERYGGGEFTVVVSGDGSVDPRLTGAWSRTSDTTFHRRTLETLRQWRFEPGVRGGVPVRSGVRLHVRTDARDDTLPSRVEWAYARGVDADTLRGTWTAEPRLPPFSPGRLDSVRLAVLRRLARMRVLVPSPDHTYCLVLQGADSAAHARLAALANASLGGGEPAGASPAFSCALTRNRRRVVLSAVHRTENGRAVVYPAGDFLPAWPPGLDGVPHDAWEGRCVTDGDPEGPARTDCAVYPPFGSASDAHPGPKAPPKFPPRPRGDSLQVIVLATTRGAFRTDTLHFTAGPPRRLRERAVLDRTAPCGGWSAVSVEESAELYVVHGALSEPWLNVTRVPKGSPPPRAERAPRCRPDEPAAADFAAFFLGGLGGAAREPVTLCFSERTECGRRYALDPARHTLAEGAAVRFRLADLREDTRAERQLVFRVHVQPARHLVPVVVVRWPGQRDPVAWLPRQTAPGTWESDAGFDCPPGTEVLLYLAAR